MYSHSIYHSMMAASREIHPNYLYQLRAEQGLSSILVIHKIIDNKQVNN